ncbi:MAG TPA: two-component regulator propeller domain-containing protein [Cyclobacteriaceae bacterium]|nr:two-component regulator propeller domain-containing protein [Cyclobacteriaceae bacterium]
MAKKVFVPALVVGCLLWMQQSFAQTEQFKFKHLSTNEGLSHPEISSIFKDSRGFIWIGTGFGLNQFDGYKVKSFFHNPHDTTSLIADGISRLYEAPEGFLVVQTSRGLNLYNSEKENFVRRPEPFLAKYGASLQLLNIVRDPDSSFWFVEPDKLIRYHDKKLIDIKHIEGDSSSIIKDNISDFAVNQKGDRWIVHSNGIAEKIEIVKGIARVVQRVFVLYHFNKSINTYYKIICDSDGDLWFCTPWLNQGVFQYNLLHKKLRQFTTNSPTMQLSANVISALVEGPNGTIWIGTDHGGINIVDKRKSTIRFLLYREGDVTSVAENSVTCLYRDDQGIMWNGTYKRGVSYYHENIYRFDLYRRYALDPGSLPFEDVNEFAEDARGNLWIGTNGGGLIYFDRQHGKFKQYLNEPGNENSLSANVIVSLCVDSEHNLWIGTYKGGLNKFDGKKFTRYKHVEGDSLSIPSQNIWEVFEDSKKRLWIGTIEYGAAQFDKTTGKYHRLKLWGPNAMQSVTVNVIAEDRRGSIWFGTTNGIDVLSSDGKTFTHYSSDTTPNSLSHNIVMDILLDSKARLWVATFDGLNLFDEATNGFKVYRHNGNNNAALAVNEDSYGHMWTSTWDGLLEMVVLDSAANKVSFKRYTESDGIQGRQFNPFAGYKTRQGELVFGGPTGFNILNSRERKLEIPPTKVVLSELELYEKPVGIGEKINGVVVLDKSMSEASEIVLPPNKNFFSIKVSALNYFNPERDRYMYKLEGLSTDWLPVDATTHEIVFNSLNPGHYKLRVKVANRDGVWGEHEAILSIIMTPPFWRTKTAFTLYGLILLIALYITRRLIQQREKLNFALEHERREIQRVLEMDMMKVKFFTNVSHEFRTPLTLILTPIEKLIKKATDPDQITQFQMIQRNGKRLMKLVSQLLDFKKLEVNEIKFNPSKGEIIDFIKETVFSFSDLSEKKNIKLQFQTSVEHFETLFDHDKLEKILFNLLSNAFKFTLENGAVSTNIELLKEGDDQYLQIDVSDTGIGIPADKLDKIFEAFFQTDLPKSIVNVGSGIGLSITKEFVRIHGGYIKVTSEVGKGSTFRIMLPVPEISHEAILIDDAPLMLDEEEGLSPHTILPDESIEKQNGKTNKKSLLLVEDNDDFRFYLKDNLKFMYTVYEASNGIEGWNQVLSIQPDLIVSDIMMPEMNGIELCLKIKSDERVSHTPVILLTARSSEEQRLEGFKTGADDYITKPFNFEVLEARINNLLRQREKSQKIFRKTLDVKSSELQITPLDVKLVEDAVKCVEKNISSPNFSVEDLGTELGISRAYVFRKIQALTGKTPLEFIRTIRMQHAAQLLEKSQLSVREIAYKVGFNNPKYFTKYFKEQFNMLPSDYASSKKAEQ